MATIRPETLGPAIGERLVADEVSTVFGLTSATPWIEPCWDAGYEPPVICIPEELLEE